MRVIKYWLVCHLWLLEREYIRFGANGEIEKTKNPKRALRFHSEEGARQFSKRLGLMYFPVNFEFDGSELAI